MERNYETTLADTAVGRTIDMTLQFYDLPYLTDLFLWEKKKLFLRFLGTGPVMMEAVLEG
jgi:hypothetical protein